MKEAGKLRLEGKDTLLKMAISCTLDLMFNYQETLKVIGLAKSKKSINGISKRIEFGDSLTPFE